MYAVIVAALALSGCAGRFDAEPGDGQGGVGTWSKITNGPLSPRHDAVGAWLADRFLIVGGWSNRPCPPSAQCKQPESPALRDGAAFDPATKMWSSVAMAPVPITDPYKAVVVGDHLYLLTGDANRADSPVSFLGYDAGRDSWSVLPLPPETEGTLVAAGAAGVVLIGWSDEQGPVSDYRFDPKTESWTRLPDDPIGPSFARGGIWLGDRLLLTAEDLVANPGSGRPSLVRLAFWNPKSNTWREGPKTESLGGGAVWVGKRIVWPTLGTADGGKVNNWGRAYSYGGILDPATGQWSTLPSPPHGKGLGGAMFTIGGRVVVGGHLLDPVSRDWTVIPEAPTLRLEGVTVIPGDHTILIWGGADLESNYADGYTLRIT